MSEIARIDVEEASRRKNAGQALLVCAYDDEVKCRRLALEGSITLGELRSLQPPHDQELIFYCA